MDEKKAYLLSGQTSSLNLESARYALDKHSLVSVTDLEGVIVYVNDLFCQVSGYSKEEILGKKHNILNSGAQTKAYWKAMHDRVLSGHVWHDEVRNRAKDGHYYWVDTTIVPNFDSNKQVIGFTSIRTDISKQKETIEQLEIAKLQAEAAKFALDQHSLVPMADIDGKISYVNEQFVRVSGYSREELIGRKHSILNSGNQPKSYWQKMHGTVLSGQVWQDEVKNRAKNGQFYWVDTTIVPNYNSKNEVVGFTSIRTDITHQKEHLEQIAIAKQQAEAAKFALDQHSLVSIADIQGNITYVNKQFEKISGYTKEELLGRKHNILNSGNQPKSYWQKMHGTVLAGNVWHDEVKNRAKDGTFYWVDTTIVPNLNTRNEVVGFTSIRTDITQQKENIERLAKAKKEADAANQAKKDFLANMSHEIRTPMNGVYASLQLLSRNEMPFEQRELVNQSLFSCECLLTIINDILDFSKIESGELKIEQITFSMRNTIESVLSDVMPTVNKDKVELTFSYADNLWDTWLGDPVRVKQVILNIVSNAVKFTESGEISIYAAPEEVNNGGSGISVVIKDTGIGMSQQMIDNLFQRFSQADNSTTRKYGGTGLGMSITQSLVAQMGGKLLVASKERVGTEFRVFLPLKKSEERTVVHSNPTLVKCPNLENKTVLVADDNTINRVIIKKALAPSKANVIEVENGELAMDMALKHGPDIVLMDIQMPVMDGITAFRMLRQKSFNAPIVAFTANVLKHDVERYLDEGFSACISKPLDIDAFYKVITTFFE
ncbi:PAS domain-containing hybrid sensor histidine kinase/response regulator [Pseudoalteromonas rubra]|uniref:Sensory/regulatory protein RpfC n=1 Tax=Pseudoalteromonas rubra TaxID=43658 RepID=A0A0U3I379_9GAMM|nr:PAS domain-containing hybrid sensor histidine kinase/response regulator [Pseudoalteromonas rubra]ALU44406.1 hypothetical protein AT705_16560 [Pseudoalteromonas rubra]